MQTLKWHLSTLNIKIGTKNSEIYIESQLGYNSQFNTDYSSKFKND